MTADSGSSRKSAPATKSPDWIQVNKRLDETPVFGRKIEQVQHRGRRNQEGQSRGAARDERHDRLRQALSQKTVYCRTCQRKKRNQPEVFAHFVRGCYHFMMIGIIDTECLPIAVERDGNCQPYRGLSRGHNHNQKHKYLPVRLTQIGGESDKTQVRGVKHQLNAEKDGDYILLYDDPYRSDSEQESA